MSYITYLGLSRKVDTGKLTKAKNLFRLESTVVEEKRKIILNRPYIYECMTLSEAPITFDWEEDLYSRRFRDESVTAFLDLCNFLKNELEPEETAILYAIWQDDPSGKLHKQEIILNDFQVKKIKISHKTLLILKVD